MATIGSYGEMSKFAKSRNPLRKFVLTENAETASINPSSGETQHLAVRGRFLPGLEGIRGLAISAVLLYHLHLGTFTGGFLGVDLFFVLSGFLITSLLIEEQLVEGKTDLLAFWIRRFKRLIPALFVLILALLVIIDLHSYFSGSATNNSLNPRFFRGDAISSIFFVMNWHAIHLVTSLQSGLFPRLLWPTWSLAVEEQFYLLWPLLTVAIFKLAGRKARALGIAVSGILALAGATYLTLLYHWSHSADRVFYSTFARGFSLAVGATLAWLVAGRAQPGPKLRRVLNLAGPLALVGMIPMFLNSGMLWGFYFPKTFMYHWGFALFAALACIVIADVRQSAPSPLARVLSFKPLRYLGTISYGLYLINDVVIDLLPGSRLHLHGNWSNLAEASVAIALASLSYRYLERPL
ncbi:MAG: acyltransferase, partial [Actinomycetes bacterium]